MNQSENYRRNAVMCYKMARMFSDARMRAVMFEMAQAWIDLAAQAERNSSLDLVYETPPPRPIIQ